MVRYTKKRTHSKKDKSAIKKSSHKKHGKIGTKKTHRSYGGKRVMRKTRRHNRKHLRGGVKYVKSNADFTGFNETVPYKVGQGIPAGELPNGRNHYALPKTSLNEPYGTEINTSLHTSVPKTFLNSQSGGSGLRNLMPQDLVNLGRSLIGNAETLYSNWNGAEPSSSANVMEQPISKPIPTSNPPIDMNKLEKHADIVAASV